MKKLYAAVLIALFTSVATSAANAAPQLPSKPPSTLKLHNGTQVVGAGKDSFTVTVAGGKIVAVTPGSGAGAMGGSMMSSKSVKFTQSSKNGICYYWWYSYGRYYYVWRYC